MINSNRLEGGGGAKDSDMSNKNGEVRVVS